MNKRAGKKRAGNKSAGNKGAKNEEAENNEAENNEVENNEVGQVGHRLDSTRENAKSQNTQARMVAQLWVKATCPQQFPTGLEPEIAFIGRSNAGKSSLINALLGRKKLAATSATPGRTRRLDFFRLEFLAAPRSVVPSSSRITASGATTSSAGFADKPPQVMPAQATPSQDTPSQDTPQAQNQTRILVDLPGYGFAKLPLKRRRQLDQLREAYLDNRRQLRCVAVTIDARIGLKTSDIEWLSTRQNLPAWIVLTKLDKLSRLQRARLRSTIEAQLRRNFLPQFELIETSATTTHNIDALRAMIYALATPILTRARPM